MTGPKHIVFVDDYPGASIGGGEQHLLRIASACTDWGYRVTIVCLPGSGLAAEACSRGLAVETVRLRGNWGTARDTLTSRLTRLAPDIVHTHGFRAMLTGLDAARRAGVPHVLTTVHNMPSAPVALHPGLRGRAEYALRRALWRKTFCCTDRFVCVVDGVRRELEAMGMPAERAVVIANGIDDPLEVSRTDAAPGTGPVLVGSVGRLELLKDYATLVSAAALVAARHPDVRFRLVGDGSLRTELERQARDLGMADRFDFAGWSQNPLDEIAGMDIYAVSSVTDTTNLTVLEAMALSRPVVATQTGGIPDAVVDGETGFLVPPRRPDLFAERIVRLVTDPGLREAMGRVGQERFLAHFTLERMLDAHKRLYAEILGEQSLGL